VDLATIEWKSEQNQFAIPYGILIRPMKIGSDRIYGCPLDRSQGWRILEIAAEARVAATEQASGAVALFVEGFEGIRAANGIYRQQDEHDGFPCYQNGPGYHLYRHQELGEWHFLTVFSPDVHMAHAFISAPEGAIPTGAQKWELRGDRNGDRDCMVTVRVLSTPEEVEQAEHEKLAAAERAKRVAAAAAAAAEQAAGAVALLVEGMPAGQVKPYNGVYRQHKTNSWTDSVFPRYKTDSGQHLCYFQDQEGEETPMWCFQTKFNFGYSKTAAFISAAAGAVPTGVQAWSVCKGYEQGFVECTVTVRVLKTVEEVEQAEQEIEDKAKHEAAVVAAKEQGAGAKALLVEGMPGLEYNGVYEHGAEHERNAFETKREWFAELYEAEGFPWYKNASGKHLYRCQSTGRWIVDDKFKPAGPNLHGVGTVYARVLAPDGAVPTVSYEWKSDDLDFWFGDGDDYAVTVQVLATQQEVEQAKHRLKDKAAAAAAGKQAEDAVALLVEGQPLRQYNGVYRQKGEDINGFPCYANAVGMHLCHCIHQWTFRCLELSTTEKFASIDSLEGAIPTGSQRWAFHDLAYDDDDRLVTVRVLATAEEEIVYANLVYEEEEVYEAMDEATARHPVSAMKKAPAARPASRPATPCRSPSRRPAVAIDATPAERGRRNSLAGGGRARGGSSSRARSRSRGRPAADGDAANSCAICGRTFPASMCGTGSKR
jgi:hypothetical protein